MRRNHLQTAMVDPRDRIWRKMTFLEGMKWREVKREISDRSTNASSCTQFQHFLLQISLVEFEGERSHCSR